MPPLSPANVGNEGFAVIALLSRVAARAVALNGACPRSYMSVAGKTSKEPRHAPICADDHGRWRGDSFRELPRTGPVRPLPPGPRMHSHHPGKLQRLLHAGASARLD